MTLNELKQLMGVITALEVGESIELDQPMGALPLPLVAEVTAKEVAGGRTVMALNATLLGIHFAELHFDCTGNDCTWRVTQ